MLRQMSLPRILFLSFLRIAMQTKMREFMRSIEPASLRALVAVQENVGFRPHPKSEGIETQSVFTQENTRIPGFREAEQCFR